MSKLVNIRFKTIVVIVLSIVLTGVGSGWCLEVSDTLQGGVWTLADSPVEVVDNIVLPSGVSLLIEAGVLVEFAGPYQFVINGLLEAVGTSDAKVMFIAAEPEIDTLRWGGLRFVNAERGCRLVFCTVQYGWARGSWPDNNGGGIYIESSSVNISHSEISHNRADGNGGGIYCWFTQSIINNSLIVENYSNSMGGGMFIAYSSPLINNCTFAFDSCRTWGGGLFIGAEGKPTISNCIIVSNFNDVDGDIAPGDDFFHDLARAKSSAPAVSFTCIRIISQDAYGGPGNIYGDPLFLNQPVGTDEDPFIPPADYHLDYSSPCIDAGDPSMGAGLEEDSRLNMGAYGGTDSSTPSVPVISVTPQNLVFGSIRTNTIVSKEVTVENKGHAHLQIENIIFDLAVFIPDSAKQDTILVPAYKIEPVAPGDRIKFSVQFLPDEIAEYSISAVFITNDTVATLDNFELSISGNGIDPIAELIESVDFGEVQIGSHAEITAVLRNTGRSTLEIGSISVQGDFFEVDIDADMLEIGEIVDVVFSFDPKLPGGTEASARINTNDRNLSVIIRGIGDGPKLVADTASIFMGYVYFDGDTANYEIPITNEGEDILNISRADFTTAAFSSNLPPEGISIEPDQTGRLRVRFHPFSADELFEDVLTISSNYPIDHVIDISGQGMPEPGRYVFGDVSGTWSVDPDNPEDYIVLDSVFVPAHATLNIGPGVRVLFEPDGKIKSEGILRAVGTLTDSIYFLPRNPSGTDEVRWGGVEIAIEDASRLVYCVIQNSTAGLKIRESSPLVQFCTISNNGLDEILNGEDGEVPAIVNIGGGISLENSGAQILSSIIEDNVGSFGGGILVLNSKPVITNCIIRRNAAVAGGGMGLVFQASALIRSNLIYDNSAVIMCGGIAVMNQSAPQIINTNIIANSGCGVYSTSTSIPVIMNCIIWDNEAVHEDFNNAVEIDEDANALVSYSDIEGGFSGTGNLDLDPGFVDGDNRDFHLSESDSSQLIDMGNQEPEHRDYSFPPSLGSEINDIGAFGGPLGGSWDAADLSISVFQNPAFPHWLDITLTTLDQLASAPSCSLGIEGSQRDELELTELDNHSFYGTYEAHENGTLFLTVDTEKMDGSRFKTGRTYELFFLGADMQTTVVPISGIAAQLEIMAGSIKGSSLILSGTIRQPVQPTDQRLYLSTPFFIHGIDGEIDPPAILEFDFDPSGWSADKLSKLNLYRLEGDDYVRLDGGYANGKVSSAIDHCGRFILGWGEQSNPLREARQPQTFELLSAYPNPFNQSTIFEINLLAAGHFSLDIFNLQGQKIITLQNQNLSAGAHRTVWHGYDGRGQSLPSGLYWARAVNPERVTTVKLLLLR